MTDSSIHLTASCQLPAEMVKGKTQKNLCWYINQGEPRPHAGYLVVKGNPREAQLSKGLASNVQTEFVLTHESRSFKLVVKTVA